MTSINKANNNSKENDLEDFLEHSLNGYVTTDHTGFILSINPRLTNWLGYQTQEMIGKRFSSFLAVGGRILYETHLSPMLRLKGAFEEVSLELLSKDGGKLSVLINGYERLNEDNKPDFIRLTVYKATERKVYEQNLLDTINIAKQKLEQEKHIAVLREQFIAVLGHDLRNPLGAIKSGSALLSRSQLSERDARIVNMIKNSSLRMEELIMNVMDFARVRLGGGMLLSLNSVEIEPIITHIVNEIRSVFPERNVSTLVKVKQEIICDSDRISQLLSNLVANALTHGAVDKPVIINADLYNNNFILSVTNGGKPIPLKSLETLFEPFTREANSPSQQGLGLGLYIASQIAKAHNGTLTATSNESETCFKFEMPIKN